MRSKLISSGTRKLGPASFIILVAGLSAACSDSARFKQPLFTGSTDNQRAIIDQTAAQPMPPALNSGAVAKAPLPPPPQLASSAASPTYAPQRPQPAGPYAWTAVGGSVITVGAGETVNDLAVKYGVPAEQILAANQLTSPAQVSSGRVLVIPRRVSISPDPVQARPVQQATYQPAYQPAPQPTQVAAAPPAPAKPAPVTQPAPVKVAKAPSVSSGGTYVVQPGDTLYSIARRHGARVDDLARINNLTSAAHIRVGQRLALDTSGATSAPAPARQPKVAAAPTTPVKKAPVTTSPTQTASVAKPQVPAKPKLPAQATTPVTTADIDRAADPASTNGTSFRWPVRGRIISAFGPKSGGERNDGINLAVPEGTSVKATEAGTVIYAGNELEGFGNLVLVRHKDGWVSAYAHNKSLAVRRGEKVRRGQTIGLAGMSGSVSTPQVHFELRRGAKPVNPLDYLAGA